MPPPPWGQLQLPDEETVAVRVGPRDLWFSRQGSEVWLTHAPGDDGDASGEPAASPEEDAEWARWAAPSDFEGEIRLRPALPDRPVVLVPERSFHLVRRARSRVYLRVPLFIQVELAGSHPQVLAEVPSVTLSDTWLGTFLEGRLAYWLPTGAEAVHDPGAALSHEAACPLSLANRTPASLEVQKVALRARHLSLFHHESGFWTDETKIVYREEGAEGEVETTGAVPPEAQGATLVADPRDPAKGGFRATTFSRLLSLSPLEIAG